MPSPLTPVEMASRSIELLKAFCDSLFKANFLEQSPPVDLVQVQKAAEAFVADQVGALGLGLANESSQSVWSEYQGSRFFGYGGNTTCIEVKSSAKAQGQSIGGKVENLIIDGGSGIRLLGYDLMKGAYGKGMGEVHILMTHFHWDHLMGLPFFTPLFIKGNKIHFHAVQPELEQVIRSVFRKPYFPLNFEDLAADIFFHPLTPRQVNQFGDFKVSPYQLDHPDPCWGFLIESEGKRFSHCVDTECTRVTRDELGLDLPLYQNVDLMIFDAQYTLMEAIEKVNWGHAAATLGIDIALRENIKKVIFMHHDPASSDKKISQALDQAKRYHQTQLKSAKREGVSIFDVNWMYAHEGLELEV